MAPCTMPGTSVADSAKNYSSKYKNKLAPLITDQCPFTTPPKTNMPVTWVKPKLLCEVSFAEWTSDKHMRQPIFEGLREDKKPSQVKKETASWSRLPQLQLYPTR